MVYQPDNLYQADCTQAMQQLPAESVDVILTDPPYLYLKNQKLDRPFDEALFFAQCKRVLKKNGFIMLFGRGTSFYRWNTLLADLGFRFKEELIWDKGYSTSPLMAVSRVHETVSLHAKGRGTVNKVKVPYLELKQHDMEGVVADVKRLKAVLKNTASLNAVLEFLETNKVKTLGSRGESTTISSQIAEVDRCASVMNAVRNGMNAKTIIKQARDHYSTIHPTQKPVKLLERLLALTAKQGMLCLDPFAGSGSTLIAASNMGLSYIGFELDDEYYTLSKERLENHRKIR
jgi:site-specific DNA-methyltransferase (adenine-specific)